MSRQQPLQSGDARSQHVAGAHDGPLSAGEFPWWMTSRQAMAYVGNRSLKAWYEWRKKHGIVARSNGTVCRRDLDKALARPRKPYTRTAISLANLTRRHGSASPVVAEGSSGTADAPSHGAVR